MAAVVWLGIAIGGKQHNASDFFSAAGRAPWWLVSGSIVATETSILTVVGIPALAYDTDFRFLQLVAGYVLGRYLVAWLFIPKYHRGAMVSVYEWVKSRLGSRLSKVSAAVFISTRLAADGVRVYAGAVVLQEAFQLGFWLSASIILVASLLLTLLGGLRAVLWTDFIQLIIYVCGALFALFVVWQKLPAGAIVEAWEMGKFQVFDFNLWSSSDYSLWSGLFGGAVFTLASHGTDQLIVQRSLSCANVRLAQRAMVVSGWAILFQMVLFLTLGVFLWGYFHGQDPELAGPQAFPRFIVSELPVGVRGLLVAAIFSAAISTLSSSLSAISASWIADFSRHVGSTRELIASRKTVVVAALGFALTCFLFRETREGPVDLVGFALGIATMTYSALLGTFIYAFIEKSPNSQSALAGFVSAFSITALIRFSGLGVAWPWLTPIGTASFLIVAWVFDTYSRRKMSQGAM